MHNYKSFLALLCLCALVLTPPACARGAGGTRARQDNDVVYGKAFMAEAENGTPTLKPLYADIFRPPNTVAPPWPAVILIHGGGFERGSKENGRQRQLAQTLADNGYVCFLINYRLLHDYPPAPAPHHDPLSRAVHAAVVDVKTALRHITANSDAYRIDPERIALVGSSAGAIAALAAGLSTADLFADDGPEFPVPPENLPGVEARAAAIVNLWGTADFFPELFSENAPPIMTVHGDRDFRVGLSLLPAENIDAQCKQYGIPHHYYPLPDAGHGPWDATVDGKPLEALILGFLDEYLK